MKGIIAVQFENTALYLSKEHYKRIDTQNAIWLRFNFEKLKLSWEELQKFDGQLVIVEGILDKEDRGYWQAYSATIDVNQIIIGNDKTSNNPIHRTDTRPPLRRRAPSADFCVSCER